MALRIKTKIPGPRSQKILSKKHKNVPLAIPDTIPVVAKKAWGAEIEDVDGNVFIDFMGGIGATNSGHSNPAIIKAAKTQAEKLFHTCFPILPYEPYIQVCEKLNSLTHIPKAKSALFNSGAEAVENAVKIARVATRRPAVVSFEHGFHGRTLLTMSMTSKVKPYKFGFGPFAPEMYKLPYPYTYRRPDHCDTQKQYIDHLINHVETEFFRGVVDPEHIACVVMELVTGEGGFIVSPKPYVKRLFELCHDNGILFVVDEVQTGFGRTGSMFAYEQYGIKPDIVITAKSLANGLPLSAVTGAAKIMDSIQPGGLGGTFGGNPVSCAAALATLDYITKHKLWEKAKSIGKVVEDEFAGWTEEFESIGEHRGLGAMRALEFVKNKKTKLPDEALVKAITKEAYERGLLLLSSGILGNDIRTLMPLTIEKSLLEEGLTILHDSIEAAQK